MLEVLFSTASAEEKLLRSGTTGDGEGRSLDYEPTVYLDVVQATEDPHGPLARSEQPKLAQPATGTTTSFRRRNHGVQGGSKRA